MNRELYIHTLRMLREQYEIARMDTVVETIDAALAEFERPTDGDCISRQAALNMEISDAICEGGAMYASWRNVRENLENLPSAQSEIIRCKECVDYQIDWIPESAPDKHYCATMDNFMPEDGFCNYAERRTDG